MGLALVIFLLLGLQKGWSVLAGGMAYWLPTLLFIWRVTLHTTAHAATRFMMAFFAGEIVKLFLSALLFLLILKYGSVNVIYEMVGLIGAIVAYWIASVMCVFRREQRS